MIVCPDLFQGDDDSAYVQMHNAIARHAALVIQVCGALGLHYIVEQPASSLLWMYRCANIHAHLLLRKGRSCPRRHSWPRCHTCPRCQCHTCPRCHACPRRRTASHLNYVLRPMFDALFWSAASEVRLSLEPFGSDSRKPLCLVGTVPWLAQLREQAAGLRKKMGGSKRSNAQALVHKRITKNGKLTVTGNPAQLKKSGAYPPLFGQAAHRLPIDMRCATSEQGGPCRRPIMRIATLA